MSINLQKKICFKIIRKLLQPVIKAQKISGGRSKLLINSRVSNKIIQFKNSSIEERETLYITMCT